MPTETDQRPIPADPGAPADADGAPEHRTDTDPAPPAIGVADRAGDDPGGSPPAPPPPTFVRELSNCSPDLLTVRAADRELRLSPLATLAVDEANVAVFALDALAERQVVRLSNKVQAKVSTWLDALSGLGFLALIGYFVLLGLVDNPQVRIVVAWGVPVVALLVGLIVMAGLNKRFGDVVQGMSLVAVLVLCAGVPVAVAITFGNLPALRADGWNEQLFGRLAQTVLICIASLLPPLLYFIFDRQRALTIRRNFQQQILRFDPNVHTLYDLEAKYGNLLLESVGRDTVQRARLRQTNPYPIFVASAVITLGWLLVLPVVDSGPIDLQAFLTPAPTTAAFGFLGAYFFTLNLLARRYVRGDLRPKAYATITVRIIVVTLLCWVLDTFATQDAWLLVTAFIIGIVPETFFTIVAEFRRSLTRIIFGEMREPHPLTRLEGIDLYDRARLEDEGVNNIEALAHHDLVELMLATRIPVPRLVDWVDQAILYLHTVDETGRSIGRDKLRTVGIRTASDLVCVHADSELWTKLALLVDPSTSSDRLDLLIAAIQDDEWVVNVLEWRKDRPPGRQTYEVRDGIPQPA
jgi:hypothetical protein